MKIDLNSNLTKNKVRTLNGFKLVMYKLLSMMPFEEITVDKLCKEAEYPRATFYNYFQDKYDLLEYCFINIANELNIEFTHQGEENEMLFSYFDRIYEFSSNNIDQIKKILIFNKEDSYLFSSFRSFLSLKMKMIFKDCDYAQNKHLPKDLLSEHYANTLFLVWKWAFIMDKSCTKSEALKYLESLIGNIN